MLKQGFILVLLAIAAMFAVGCDDQKEQGTVIVAVAAINDGSPLESDVASTPLLEDVVNVSLAARAYNEFVTAPHDAVVIDSYRITWTRADGGPVLAPREEVWTLFVQAPGGASGAIRLVTWDDKMGPVLSTLAGTTNTITMRAHVAFTGHIPGTTDEVKTSTDIDVSFADLQ